MDAASRRPRCPTSRCWSSWACPRRGASGQHGIADVSLAVHGGEIVGVGGHRRQRPARARRGDRRSAAARAPETSGWRARRSPGPPCRSGSGWDLRYVTDDRLGEGVVGRLRREPQPRPQAHRRARPSGAAARSTAPPSTPRRGRSSRSSTSGPRRRRRASASSAAATSRRRSSRASCRSSRGSSSSTSRPTAWTSGPSRAVRERIRALADRGVAIVVISTDLDELIDLCDRVAVLFEGRIVGIVDNGPGAETRIGELIVGGSHATRARPHDRAPTMAPDPAIETAARIPGRWHGRADALVAERRAHRPGAAHRRRPAGHHRAGPGRVLPTTSSRPACSARPGCRTPSPGWRPCCSSARGSSSPSGPSLWNLGMRRPVPAGRSRSSRASDRGSWRALPAVLGWILLCVAGHGRSAQPGRIVPALAARCATASTRSSPR